MRYFFFPTQDTTIYSAIPTKNAGLDEQLEVGKTNNGHNASRMLVQFDVPSISASISSQTIPAGTKFELTLHVSNAERLKAFQRLEFYSLSQSWEEGTGYYYQDVFQENDGSTWLQRMSGSQWVTSGSDFLASPITSSILGNPVRDVTVDITSAVRSWISGTVPNNGLVVKFPDSNEVDLSNFGCVRFFSKDTHTIYRPTLAAVWNDQTFTTGSLLPLPSVSTTIIPVGLKPGYFEGETARVQLLARERYPLKTFSTQFTRFSTTTFLPTSSYFSVVDDLSGHTIIPFDSGSLISCDSSGSFFKFKVQHMYPLRFYRILLKIERDGAVEIIDTKTTFSVKQ